MAATVTDITTRTTAFGRVIEGILKHRAGERVDFVALGMVLRTELATAAWTITRLDENERVMATVTISVNATSVVGDPKPYPFAKRYVVLAQVGRIVISDAHTLEAALADALETIYRSA